MVQVDSANPRAMRSNYVRSRRYAVHMAYWSASSARPLLPLPGVRAGRARTCSKYLRCAWITWCIGLVSQYHGPRLASLSVMDILLLIAAKPIFLHLFLYHTMLLVYVNGANALHTSNLEPCC